MCDENGRIEKIVPRTRNDAHKLIEEAMLAANVCSADFIEQGGRRLPSVYMRAPRLRKKGNPARVSSKAMAVGMSTTTPNPSEFQAICRGDQKSGLTRSKFHHAAVHAAGHLHAHQQRPFRLGI